MTTFVECSPHVRSADLGAAVVILDHRTGRVEALLGWARRAWLELAHTADPRTVSNGGDQLRRLVRQLTSDGVLRPAAGPRPWAVTTIAATRPSWGTQEVPGSIPPRTRQHPARMMVAVIALAIVLATQHIGRRSHSFTRITKLLTAATRPPARTASPDDVARALHCVRNVASIMPFRVACLEETAAAMLAMAIAGRRAGWCHGVAADPIRLHAWITLDGHPVAEPADTTRYTPLLRIP